MCTHLYAYVCVCMCLCIHAVLSITASKEKRDTEFEKAQGIGELMGGLGNKKWKKKIL